MTSNGLILPRLLPDLIRNGLTHVNLRYVFTKFIHRTAVLTRPRLSLDTLDPFKFEIMTRRRGHEAVLRSLDMALAAPELETKLNVVVVKGLNDHEVLDFIALTQHRPVSVRFIEFMPFTGTRSSLGIASARLTTFLQATSGTRQRWSRPPRFLNT